MASAVPAQQHHSRLRYALETQPRKIIESFDMRAEQQTPRYKLTSLNWQKGIYLSNRFDSFNI